MKVTRFEDLEIWQEARELCKFIFEITLQEPFRSDYKLRDQIRGSSGSIMDNIAEGFARGGNKEFIQFLSIANGSSAETQSQSYRAFDFDYITKDHLADILSRTNQLGKKITSFISYLRKSDYKGSKFNN